MTNTVQLINAFKYGFNWRFVGQATYIFKGNIFKLTFENISCFVLRIHELKGKLVTHTNESIYQAYNSWFIEKQQ